MITGRSLIDAASGRVLLDRLRIADRFFDRLRGQLGRPQPQPDEGLWLEPCNSVHMFFMAYALDVVFLDARGRVLRLLPDLQPWRASPIVRGARVAVEMAPGSIDRLALQSGMTLQVKPID